MELYTKYLELLNENQLITNICSICHDISDKNITSNDFIKIVKHLIRKTTEKINIPQQSSTFATIIRCSYNRILDNDIMDDFIITYEKTGIYNDIPTEYIGNYMKCYDIDDTDDSIQSKNSPFLEK